MCGYSLNIIWSITWKVMMCDWTLTVKFSKAKKLFWLRKKPLPLLFRLNGWSPMNIIATKSFPIKVRYINFVYFAQLLTDECTSSIYFSLTSIYINVIFSTTTGRLFISNSRKNCDNGLIDELLIFGGRDLSLLNPANLSLIATTGDELEKQANITYGSVFNGDCSHGLITPTDEVDTRSDDMVYIYNGWMKINSFYVDWFPPHVTTCDSRILAYEYCRMRRPI